MTHGILEDTKRYTIKCITLCTSYRGIPERLPFGGIAEQC